MRLFISKKRWHEIFRVLARRKRKQICLFGTRVNGRYRVLWAAGARGIRTAGRALARGRRIGKSSRNSKSRFLGVLFIHPPGKYWLTWEELGRIRKLLGRHMELVSGVLVSSAEDRKSTRLNSSHSQISYAVFCLKKKKKIKTRCYQK